MFDSNYGWVDTTSPPSTQSWMWKRHAGFDVVTYTSPGGNNRDLPHSLGKVPEMIWIKNRNLNNSNWTVYHEGLNGGTNPQNYGLHLNSSSGEVDDYGFFSDIAPTSTFFTTGYDGTTGGSGNKYIAMLFASVPGISKCGYYTGTGSNPTITTGFSPRFLLIKRTNTSGDWMTFDTVRGFSQGSGAADCYLKLNTNDAQNCNDDWGYPTSDGFVIATNQQTGGNTSTYIYYAHA